MAMAIMNVAPVVGLTVHKIERYIKFCIHSIIRRTTSSLLDPDCLVGRARPLFAISIDNRHRPAIAH